MDIIQFIYTLLSKHIPPAQITILEKEAQAWYRNEDSESVILKTVRKYGETWWCKTLLAVIFIFASRWLFEFMNPQVDNSDDDDDDND